LKLLLNGLLFMEEKKFDYKFEVSKEALEKKMKRKKK
jgi:hypothetical protein